MKTDDSGNLVISSAAGDVLLHKPVAYQEQNGARQAVDARFVLKANNQVCFELGNYDRSRELVIDPSVTYEYSTYLGGNGNDAGYGIAFDSTGNAYVTGQTASTNFPGVSSANNFQALLMSLSPRSPRVGQALSTPPTLAVPAATAEMASPWTLPAMHLSPEVQHQPTFPSRPPGAFQTTLKGALATPLYLSLIPDGTSLTYSTYLGGTGDDVALGIALDSTGTVYTVGKDDFHRTSPPLNPLQATRATGGFVTKLNSSRTGASALVYSTYLGGSSTRLAVLQSLWIRPITLT